MVGEHFTSFFVKLKLLSSSEIRDESFINAFIVKLSLFKFSRMTMTIRIYVGHVPFVNDTLCACVLQRIAHSV